ncbi:MAG: L-serine ammonia-lyase, iron-sulfur-dependent, subunit alpha [Butyrivibrio sp.]|nr:L-serine ammonia-lyase, iron-sulfur-dependent, subunit alpha [Butyrivibrio sp.]
MKREDEEYKRYIKILERELVPAMGCTEPIAIAYAAAYAKKLLDGEVSKVKIYASGNVIKNVKSVTVPNTGGQKGIAAAAAIGIADGNPELKLEVISSVTQSGIKEMERLLSEVPFELYRIQGDCALDLAVELLSESGRSKVRIRNTHENVVLAEKNGECILRSEYAQESGEGCRLEMKEIYDFAVSVELDDVRDILQRQIDYNYAIAKEGLKGGYGASIGRVLLDTYGESPENRAKALAAAGSDARMGGCELPVIINSGSGNQGMCASLPVIAYAKELDSGEERLYRALIISNLTTLYQKQFIGRLSAYCGAVSAGAGAGAGITYLLGGDYKHICHTVVNALAVTSGILCDGAKPSCAAKIACAVDAGILGCKMYKEGHQFYRGEGIVSSSIENTMEGIGKIARDGMKECDDEIIRLMLEEQTIHAIKG